MSERAPRRQPLPDPERQARRVRATSPGRPPVWPTESFRSLAAPLVNPDFFVRRQCQWRDCSTEAALSIYNRVLDECLPEDAPIAIMYSCDRHARAIAHYCHAVDEDITYIGPF